MRTQQVLDIHTALQHLWIRVFRRELDELQPLSQAIQEVYDLCKDDEHRDLGSNAQQ